jgi:hypothetical protein
MQSDDHYHEQVGEVWAALFSILSYLFSHGLDEDSVWANNIWVLPGAYNAAYACVELSNIADVRKVTKYVKQDVPKLHLPLKVKHIWKKARASALIVEVSY